MNLYFIMLGQEIGYIAVEARGQWYDATYLIRTEKLFFKQASETSTRINDQKWVFIVLKNEKKIDVPRIQLPSETFLKGTIDICSEEASFLMYPMRSYTEMGQTII